jgi:flavin reductase (DIM6/NTAB) family NADH-FMN oxidoreductase RutF
METIDTKELRRALGAFTTGVAVVTTISDLGKRHGVTVNSFSSVSLDPPLVLWSQAVTAKSHSAFKESNRFAVNIMADDQIHISNHFAKSAEEKFTDLPCREGLGGVPIIEGAAAYLECVKVAEYPGGDHVIFIGRVENFYRSPRRALAFGEGKYLLTVAHDLAAS